MRIAPLFTILLVTTSPALAQDGDYCFSPAGKPKAVMSFSSDPDTMSITENGKTETWERGTSVGTGLNGQTYLLGDDLEVVYSTTILMDTNTDPPDEPTI